MSLAEPFPYPRRPPSRRLLRALRRTLLLIVAVIVVGLGAGAVYVATLPGVGDARARAQRLMAAHHERPGGLEVAGQACPLGDERRGVGDLIDQSAPGRVIHAVLPVSGGVIIRVAGAQEGRP